MRIHCGAHGGEAYGCDTCGKTFINSSGLTKHKKKHHVVCSPRVCGVCGEAFPTDFGLSLHGLVHAAQDRTASHPAGVTHFCEDCGAALPSRVLLESHRAAVHPHKEGLHRCRFCAYFNRYQSRVARHERIHTGERPYRCQVCGKAFSQKGDLGIHRRIHFREEPYRCHVCGREFTHKKSFVRHQKLH
ncbi:zinc finger, C2H2 type, putative [Ixodes scapularis]|uniref:Zinc finger, C2H2 type, putative n=1 Tax=Ixodes scapularis TaxID=6945 RepID=B7P1R7_IXOSC|nr:zinc finger, C2H2 type, putative [Ixodes scapularis]|eukprot:XP_002433475.1 zinc finger, C2H2 type, putative [Ixodes scapularis]